jgi:hypothetical protein
MWARQRNLIRLTPLFRSSSPERDREIAENGGSRVASSSLWVPLPNPYIPGKMCKHLYFRNDLYFGVVYLSRLIAFAFRSRALALQAAWLNNLHRRRLSLRPH